MARQSKIRVEEKIRIVQDCRDGRISQTEAARRIRVDRSVIQDWVRQYESEGSIGLETVSSNRTYSEELKRQAVLEYQAGNSSIRGVCKKYKIRSTSQLILNYN